jgi:hypothetical protein
VLACIVPPNGRLGLFLVAVVLLFVGFTYLGRVRRLEAGDAPVVTS